MNPVYLIAEDDLNTQTIVAHAFKRGGFDFPVYFTSDGKETLDYLRGDGKYRDRDRYPYPAVLLLDYNMPRLNGLGVLQAIRADMALKKLAVIMFSSSIEEPEIERAYALGANSYVEKPVDFGELVHVVSCIHQYWFGCNHFPHPIAGVVRPQKKGRP